MAKLVSDNVLDAALDYIKNNCSKMTICSQQPTTYTEALTTYALADVAMTSTDFTIADGDVSGRKITVAQKAGVTVDTTGTGVYIALLYESNTELLLVTTCTSQALTQGNTMTFDSWDDEISDPT